jgi:ABC-type transport system involved in cytochrome c biogenesis permease subunit
MIESSAFWLRVAACLYAVGLLHALLSAVRQGQSVFGIAIGAFRIAVVVHAVAITDLAIASGHIPIDNFYQTLSFCAFLTATLFVALERHYRLSSASVALFPLVFAMTLAGALEQPVASPASDGMRDVWLVVHILLVLAGYAALLFTALTAGAYLVQERRLKTKQASALLERLPPLGTLDTMLTKSLGFGFVFLTLGLVIAVLWAFRYAQTSWISDPSITISVFTWLLLVLMMFLRASAGWRGRKVAVMSLVVLGCSALTWVTHTGLGATLTP